MFREGCCEMDGSDFEELCKRTRKSTTSQNTRDKTQFAPLVSCGKMAEICKGYILLTTVRSISGQFICLTNGRKSVTSIVASIACRSESMACTIHYGC